MKGVDQNVTRVSQDKNIGSGGKGETKSNKGISILRVERGEENYQE